MYRSQTLLFIFSFVLILSCQDRPRNNPFDPETEIDPSEWAPTNLKSEVINDSLIQLTWESNNELIEGFIIERKENGGIWTQISKVSPIIRSFIDPTVFLLENYKYRICAFAMQNKSSYSNVISIINSVTDIDNNVYPVVEIGTQIWMTENLKVTHYRNGDPISTGYNESQWTSLVTGAYAIYDENNTIVDTYGLLYNWFAVNEIKGLAPEGWHVPTDEEWKQLEMYVGMSLEHANSTGWRGTNEGSKLAGNIYVWGHWSAITHDYYFDVTGLSLIPGGRRYPSQSYPQYHAIDSWAYYWSSIERSSNNAWGRTCFGNYTSVSRGSYGKTLGFSVRCVKD